MHTPTLDQLTPDIIKQAHATFTDMSKSGTLKTYLERWNEIFAKSNLADPSQQTALIERLGRCNPNQAEQNHEQLLIIGWLIGRLHEQAVARASKRAA